MAIVPCPIDLLRPNGDTEELIDLIEEVSRNKGNVKLVIIDTLSRALSGGNENSPDDMGNLVKHLDKIRHTLKTHLCIIHHSGKDRAKGARGHSLLRASYRYRTGSSQPCNQGQEAKGYGRRYPNSF